MKAAASGPGDRISKVWVEGVRSLDAVELELDGLTVLIGPNGSGKSTLLEALELFRLMSTGDVDDEVQKTHGGMRSLLRRGAGHVFMRVETRGPAGTMGYEIELGAEQGFTVFSEHLAAEHADGITKPVLVRGSESRAKCYPVDDEPRTIEGLTPNRLALSAWGLAPPHEAIRRMTEALGRISVHVPFDVKPGWVVGPEPSALRGANVLRPTRKLERFGENLANAWHARKNDFSEEHWRETMRAVRAGLGPEINSVATQADPGGGQIAIKLRYQDGSEDPAFTLSDGTLAYLAFVALSRLAELPAGRTSLLAFDEPELHLHPELLVRVVGFFEEMAKTQPVVLATHSDRLLDVLSTPADSVVLCELDEERRTVLSRPNRERLDAWLDRFRGIGELRAEGMEAALFEAADPEEDEDE